jgi:hypothetical protein
VKPNLPPLKCLEILMDDVDPADLREFWRIFERVAKLQPWSGSIHWRRGPCTGRLFATEVNRSGSITG